MSVTPTPFKAMRRGYRSSAMDDESKFPSAVGIPDQQHWDPFRQLEELKNAPGELLSKRSPPSPSRGSPPSVVSSSGSRVSSSMPVPEKEFHITAYQRRHEEAVASLSSSSFSTVSAGELDGQQQYGVEGVPWRPQPRRYTAASTQTESLDVSDAEAQSDGEEIDAEMAALKIRKP
ncbi:hypothetical protein DRE_01420 [Drechslerella stenobrocha 248]|uniref:Uncharacterized protein n=1 Tax=Drechslerella stenobrocha 248 TaxID=1043628 RepID=W7HVZ3_9PEZI|nr:hypothetical protein DRE_01420 [Drechslerella stenobrocha 248]